MKNRQTLISLSIVVVLLSSIYYIGTDGFTAYTAETSRTNQLVNSQPEFPEVVLEDSLNREYNFSQFEGQYVFITFFYSACSTVCIQLEENMGEVYEALPEEFLGEDVTFLSISFDPERDTPEVLNSYQQYFGSDGETWRMARINDDQELNNLLDTFEVVVIPTDDGHFTHNSAFYVVNPDGHLTAVLDYQDIDSAVDYLLEELED
ncbi:SCO family protein [Alkalibacillus aidingensis]|uniref:SCO family protein n=1 Tax=Alkalibacillus aidingensis TaxID=2747607 RepID=UPI002948B795|nr:SCO family protein [Alkalibacillus aidingensis]